MLNEDKKQVMRYVECELHTHMFEDSEYVSSEMIRKTTDYCKRLGVPSVVTVESINSSHIEMKIDDGSKSFIISAEFDNPTQEDSKDKIGKIIKN